MTTMLVFLLLLASFAGSESLRKSGGGLLDKNSKFITTYPIKVSEIVHYYFKHLPENGYST
jgi:hypothetical protein